MDFASISGSPSVLNNLFGIFPQNWIIVRGIRMTPKNASDCVVVLFAVYAPFPTTSAELAMYSIVVTAGPSLDESTHQCVHVNSETYIPISNDDFEGQLTVRVKDFNGLAPEGCEPIPQSSYFETAKDTSFSIEASGEINLSG